MNQREPTSTPIGVGQTLSCLALLLLPMVAAARAWSRPALPMQDALPHPRTYLVALGSPPLRFEEPAPPPDLVTRPAAGAPPRPAMFDEPLAGQDQPAAPAAVSASSPSPTADHTPVPGASTDSATTPPTEAQVPVHTPPPILPDDVRPQTRPEDFLPFFQIPATQPGGPSVIVPVPRIPASPAPAPLPPSSATYTQTPR